MISFHNGYDGTPTIVDNGSMKISSGDIKMCQPMSHGLGKVTRWFYRFCHRENHSGNKMGILMGYIDIDTSPAIWDLICHLGVYPIFS